MAWCGGPAFSASRCLCSAGWSPRPLHWGRSRGRTGGSSSKRQTASTRSTAGAVSVCIWSASPACSRHRHGRPTGSGSAFASNRGSADFEIYSIGAQGGGITPLMNNTVEDNDPSWSPDGSRIAFARVPDVGPSQIYVMNADGTSELPLISGILEDSAPRVVARRDEDRVRPRLRCQLEHLDDDVERRLGDPTDDRSRG